MDRKQREKEAKKLAIQNKKKDLSSRARRGERPNAQDINRGEEMLCSREVKWRKSVAQPIHRPFKKVAIKKGSYSDAQSYSKEQRESLSKATKPIKHVSNYEGA